MGNSLEVHDACEGTTRVHHGPYGHAYSTYESLYPDAGFDWRGLVVGFGSLAPPDFHLLSPFLQLLEEE